MKISELENLTPEELTQKGNQLKRELFDLRMQAASGKLDKPHHIHLVRKDVARIQTLLNRKEVSSKRS